VGDKILEKVDMLEEALEDLACERVFEGVERLRRGCYTFDPVCGREHSDHWGVCILFVALMRFFHYSVANTICTRNIYPSGLCTTHVTMFYSLEMLTRIKQAVKKTTNKTWKHKHEQQ